MAFRFFAILAFAALAAALKFDKEKPETAIEKVLRVLRTLRGESQAEGVQEQADFKKFFKFCDVTENEKMYRIAQSDKKIKRLTAEAEDLKSKLETLTTDVADLSDEIDKTEGKIKKTEDERAKEVAKYDAAAAEIDNSISTLERAIQTLLTSQENLEGSVGLSQLKQDAGDLLDKAEKSSLLQMSESQVQALISLQNKPGAAPGYTFKSGDIIATLKGLLTTFKSNKQTLDITESQNKMTYDTLMTNLKSQLKFTKEAHEEKSVEKDEKTATKADTDKDNEDEKADMAADKAFLKALQKDCDDKDKLSKRRKAKREEEIQLLTEAIQRTEKIPGSRPTKGAFVQSAPAALSFLQMGNSNDIQESTADMLMSQSKKLGSQTLSLAAAAVQAVSSADPFVQIRKVFKTLVAKLNAQAENDKSNKEWCDQQILINTGKRDAAQIKIEELHGLLAKQGSSKDKYLAEIADLEFEINKSTVELQEATEFREEEHKKNLIAIDANGKAAAAVKNSLDFYDDTGSFLQTGEDPVDIDARDKHGKNLQDYAPKVATTEYAGSKNSGGVIGILQKVWSDFTRAVAEITANEKEAADDYADYKKQTDEDIKRMGDSAAAKDALVKGLSSSIGKLVDEEEDEQEKLGLAKDELEKLHGMCIVPAMSYEEKRAKRQQEIDGLKEASDYLEDLIQEKKAEE